MTQTDDVDFSRRPLLAHGVPFGSLVASQPGHSRVLRCVLTISERLMPNEVPRFPLETNLQGDPSKKDTSAVRNIGCES